MKTNFVFFLAFLFFPAITIFAQNPGPGQGRPGQFIEYQSPNDGDLYVPIRTTIIVRPHVSPGTVISAGDFSFTVHGDSSGSHTGRILIADDNATVIFKPDQAFSLDENIHVRFSFTGNERNAPACFSFRTTSLTDKEQRAILDSLRRSENSENEVFAKKAVAERTEHLFQSSTSDSLGLSIDIYVPDKVAPGNIFCAQAGGVTQNSSRLALIDNFGNAPYQNNTPSLGYACFRPWKNGTMSYFSIESVQIEEGECGSTILLDSNFAAIDTFVCGNGYLTNEHEFQLLPHGHSYVISYDPIITDMRTVTGDPTAAKHASVVGGIIQELDSLKNVIFQWRTWDHFLITDVTDFVLTNPNYTIIDYAHLNSVRRDTDGNILASFRSMDEVTKINRSNGKVIWRWGGKNNYFSFTGDTLHFSHQHDVHRIGNGHIVMMDNGNYRKTIWGDGSYHNTSYSRAVEYDIDENSLTATAVWQYGNIPPTYAGGNVQRLINGNTFIGLGTVNFPNAVEVTPAGEKVFQISFTEGAFNYRTFRYDTPLASAQGLSVNGQEQKNGFGDVMLYPNPANTLTTLSFSGAQAGPVQIELSDMLGHSMRKISEIITNSDQSSLNLDLQGLRTGTYCCRLSQNGDIVTKLLVVQK